MTSYFKRYFKMMNRKKTKIIFNLLLVIFCFTMYMCLTFVSVNAKTNTVQNNKTDLKQSAVIVEDITKNAPEDLMERITLYWKYKVNRESELCYNIEAPHIQYQIPLENYIKRNAKARKLKGCRILNVDHDNDSNISIVRTELILDDSDNFSNKTHVMNEKWIKLNNNWYHVYNNPFLNIK